MNDPKKLDGPELLLILAGFGLTMFGVAGIAVTAILAIARVSGH